MAGLNSYVSAGFQQKELIKKFLSDNNLAAKGICFALSAQWLKLHRKNRGKSPQWRIANLSRSTTMRHAAALQEVYSHKRAHGQGPSQGFGAVGAMQLAMNIEGLGLTRELTGTGSGNMVDEFATLVNSTHRYCVIGLQFGDDGGHSIACYKSNGKKGWFAHLYVFDPNIGEMKVGSGARAARTFFYQLLGHYYSERGIRLSDLRIFEVGDGDPWTEPSARW